MRRRLLAVIAALAAACLLTPASPAQAGPTQGQPSLGQAALSSISWTPCPEDRKVDCATIPVPVDWAHPAGKKFPLAVARRKATDPYARVGALVINPGGPGGSGVDFALGADGYFSPAVLRRFDIIGFDPRGVARSHAVLCDSDIYERILAPVPLTPAQFAAHLKFNRDLTASCRKLTGPLFDHVDSLSVARDIDAIRAALGEAKISYYGVSYGTLMGQMYAELFPKRIRAMVLDSNMDHSQQTAGFIGTEAATEEALFGEFVKWCNRTTTCALHGRNVKAVWNKLWAKGEQGEPGYPPPFDLLSLAHGSFYGPDFAYLAEVLADLESGAATADSLRALKRPPRAWGDPVEDPFAAVFCADWRIDIKTAKQVRTHWTYSNIIAANMRTNPLAWGAAMSCMGQAGRVTNPQHRLKVHGAPPIFITNSLYDPATPYAWAVNVHKQIPGSALLTYKGWGHGVYGRSDCVTKPMDRYLVGLTLPAAGSSCPAVPPAGVGSPAVKRPTPSQPIRR